MIHPKHLRTLIIDPVLKYLDMYSEAASDLMMGTAAQESQMGRYLMQIDKDENPVGPALGPYQMEPETEFDIVKNFCIFRPELREKMRIFPQYSLIDEFIMGGELVESELHGLVSDLAYSTAMARLKYYRDPEPLPPVGHINAMASYWKRIYNTVNGKGRIHDFTKNYELYVSEIEK